VDHKIKNDFIAKATTRLSYKKKVKMQEIVLLNSPSVLSDVNIKTSSHQNKLTMDSRSFPSLTSELELFSVSPTQLAIDKSSFIEIQPHSLISGKHLCGVPDFWPRRTLHRFSSYAVASTVENIKKRWD